LYLPACCMSNNTHLYTDRLDISVIPLPLCNFSWC